MRVLLAASQSKRLEHIVESAPISRSIVNRFVAGQRTADALRAALILSRDDLQVSIDFLGEDVTSREKAVATKNAYLELLTALSDGGLVPQCEVSLKLSALGLVFDKALALDNAAQLCAVAQEIGTTVTVDMEDHSTTDSTLDTVTQLRKDFPTTGVVLQAQLRRTEADCRDLIYAGSRIRLCKGAYTAPASVAYQSAHKVRLSYVRCANILLAGEGYPMFATHDPSLIGIVQERVDHYRRAIDSFEFQMLYGVRPHEQIRLSKHGYTVRVYVPFGTEWFRYLMRRLAEHPAYVLFFLRALISRR